MLEVDVISDPETAGDKFGVINESGIEFGTISADPNFRELGRQLSSWVNNMRTGAGRSGLFDKGMFTPPDSVYAEIQAARDAVEYDDVVSGVAEITEAFAFQGQKFESDNEETADVFNQYHKKIKLDSIVRRIWREIYTENQVYLAFTWGEMPFTPKVQTAAGKKSKKKIILKVPTKITVLDSRCCVPIQHGPVNEEFLCWSASAAEVASYISSTHLDAQGIPVDPGMAGFFVGRYEPTASERKRLRDFGVTNVDRLLIMNPETVKRYTSTKPDYELFPDIRLKPLFPLLDMKRQLILSDRAALVGAANYILLIRKGSDAKPATSTEMENLQENYSVMARLPVIIADHRLQIDIIAPKTDTTLDNTKYDLIDARILARLLGTLSIGGRGQRNETNVTMSYAVARTMENRRHMIAEFLNLELAEAIVDRNPGVFDDAPDLVYVPSRIALGFDQALSALLASLYSTRDISRETILEFVGLSEDTEALRKEIEKDRYDDIFGSVLMPGQTDPNGQVVPGAAPAGASPQTTGASGGRPVGGGTPSQNPVKKAAPKTAAGNTKPKGAEA